MNITTAIEIYRSGNIPDDLGTLLEMNSAILLGVQAAYVECTHTDDLDRIDSIMRQVQLYEEIIDAIAPVKAAPMPIDEIIEAWDKQQLPEYVGQLTEMLAAVEQERNQAFEKRKMCIQHESREMYYFRATLMDVMAGDIKSRIAFRTNQTD